MPLKNPSLPRASPDVLQCATIPLKHSSPSLFLLPPGQTWRPTGAKPHFRVRQATHDPSDVFDAVTLLFLLPPILSLRIAFTTTPPPPPPLPPVLARRKGAPPNSSLLVSLLVVVLRPLVDDTSTEFFRLERRDGSFGRPKALAFQIKAALRVAVSR